MEYALTIYHVYFFAKLCFRIASKSEGQALRVSLVKPGAYLSASYFPLSAITDRFNACNQLELITNSPALRAATALHTCIRNSGT